MMGIIGMENSIKLYLAMHFFLYP